MNLKHGKRKEQHFVRKLEKYFEPSRQDELCRKAVVVDHSKTLLSIWRNSSDSEAEGCASALGLGLGFERVMQT
jgi:hypothetical protein